MKERIATGFPYFDVFSDKLYLALQSPNRLATEDQVDTTPEIVADN
jgi:hypothetical protein